MLSHFINFFLYIFIRFIIWLRYSVTVKGLEKLNKETLTKPGGILFLPNHPTVIIDPIIMNLFTWKKFHLRPLVVEYMYYAKTNHWLMRIVNALPVPDFDHASNSVKRKRNDRAFKAIITGLEKGENFLVYPGARVKRTAVEIIGGNSGTQQLIQQASSANIVLVRIKGLWGSSFSKAVKISVADAVKHGIKACLKNLIFFMPRRQVIIELEPAGPDFPYNGSRLDVNRYLENWYNKPDGLVETDAKFPGDSLILVSYSRWKDDYLIPETAIKQEEIDISQVPPDIKKRIIDKLVEMTNIEASKIKPEMQLSADLGMDSLDVGELATFLSEEYNLKGLKIVELTTIGRVMGLASRLVIPSSDAEEDQIDFSKWYQRQAPHTKVTIAPGNTIPEVFLNNCVRMQKAVACADSRTGVMAYDQLKIRALVLANYISKLPGESIGIMLPASVTAYLTILACQIAGKVPVMINWTLGPRFLESIIQQSKTEVVLSSWTFLDKLHYIDFGILDEQLLMLEDVRREITLMDKFKAFLLSKKSTKAILSHFSGKKEAVIPSKDKEPQTEVNPGENTAVLLFTSGSENTPKGVPLSHYNIISNFRSCLATVAIYSDDTLLGILPPFHSFGFTMAGLLGFLVGFRVAYFPDPRESAKIVNEITRWKPTLLCTAPTFLKGILREGQSDQFHSLRLCWTGAEKAPETLFNLCKEKAKNCTLLEGYGITECSPVLCLNRPEIPAAGVGQPIDNVELLIVHPETHVPLPQNTTGLILARGPNIFSGYLNSETAIPFVEVNGKQWYRTGDLGYLNDRGQLIIEGRLKRFVKVGGEMISLGAIEEECTQAALQRGWIHPEEGPCLAVCAQEISGEKSKISLFTTFKVSAEEVNHLLLTAGFNNLSRISTVIQVPTIPILGIGKVNYRELEAQLRGD